MLEESTKDEWTTAADEMNQQLAPFVRNCVNRWINGGTRPDTSGIDDDTLTHVLDELTDLNTSMESLEHQVRSIQTEVSDDPHARNLATEIYALLPSLDQIHMEIDHGGSDQYEGTVHSGRIEHIADVLDRPHADVSQALDDLRSDLHNVHTTDDGRYYRS